MEKIRRAAMVCTGRAVTFGALAIGLIMISLSFDAALAFKAGAFLTLIMTQLLVIKAMTVKRQNPKHTEVWGCLDPSSRPVGHSGKKVFVSVLEEVYARFARHSFTAACGFFAASALLHVFKTAV